MANVPHCPPSPICTHNDNSLSSSSWAKFRTPLPKESVLFFHRRSEGGVVVLHTPMKEKPKEVRLSSRNLFQEQIFQCCVTMAWHFLPSPPPFPPHRQFPHGWEVSANSASHVGTLVCAQRPAVGDFVNEQGETARGQNIAIL